MHQRRLFLSCCLTAFICCASVLAHSTEIVHDPAAMDLNNPSMAQLYDQAKFYFNQLETNESLATSRESWLKGTRNFRKLYLLNPKSDLAPSSLFMLGRMYRKMYEKFKLGIDLDESLAYYNDTAHSYPAHRLADDAHYAVGLIYLLLKQDPQKAADSFGTVVTRYPNGDMHAEASDKLKLLSKDFDIPLPQALVDNTQSEELNTILPIKYWSSKDYTRIVVMATAPITYKEVLLERKVDQPRRLYIDFQNSYIEPKYRSPVSIKDGLLQQIQTGQNSADTVRVKLDIESVDSYKIFSLPDPFRVVIDVRGERETEPIITKKAEISLPEIAPEVDGIVPQSHPQTAANKSNVQTVSIRREKNKHVFQQSTVVATKEDAGIRSSKQTISLAQQLGLGVKKIVLDPGHGGKDPGAISNSLQEKDIVLKIAQQLKPVLQKALGCEVILTRNEDIFLPLEERTAIANTQGADLFISLHINANPSSKVRGTETYFLNLSTNAEAMRVAAMENSTSTHQMSDLQDILSDILKNSKIDESSKLAKQVHTSILAGLDQKLFGQINNLGVKQAPFYVLIGAEMPAILLEIAFISNAEDKKNLQDPQYIESLTKEITRGVKAYIQTNTASL